MGGEVTALGFHLSLISSSSSGLILPYRWMQSKLVLTTGIQPSSSLLQKDCKKGRADAMFYGQTSNTGMN